MSYRITSRERAWYVVDAAGAAVAGPFAYRPKTERRCHQLAEGRSGKRGGELRQCMCCGEGFASEGPHNRLCKWCRHKDGTGIVGSPGGQVATSRSRA